MAKTSAATPATNRVTNVQVPGETASPEVEKQEVTGEAGQTLAPEDNPETGADPVTEQPKGDPEVKAPESDEAAALRAENEALRAQIAKSKAGTIDNKTRNRREYLHLKAEEVDPDTLTSAVLTKDGWVCPPSLTKAKPL